MANWVDLFSFVATVTIIGSLIYGIIFVTKQINDSVQNTKANLKNRGLDISSKGVSVTTKKRFDREHYVDATQRGFVRAIGASSFGKADNSSTNSPPGMTRSSSESKARTLFRGIPSSSSSKETH